MKKQYINRPWMKVRTPVLEFVGLFAFILGLIWLALALTGGAR